MKVINRIKIYNVQIIRRKDIIKKKTKKETTDFFRVKKLRQHSIT